MNDMSRVIIPDSSQINADELQAGPITVKIAGVKIKGGKEQPVDIILEGMEKVYRPCKSMCRCMVAAWGADSSKYIGRSMTLYCDPTVKWAGLAVGGLRISHMSDISDDMTMALTVTRANKKPFTVRPIIPSHGPLKASAQAPSLPGSPPSAAPAAEAPTLAQTLAAIDAMKGQKSAAACIDMLAELDEAERLIAQEAYDFRVAELKAASTAASKPKSREALMRRI